MDFETILNDDSNKSSHACSLRLATEDAASSVSGWPYTGSYHEGLKRQRRHLIPLSASCSGTGYPLYNDPIEGASLRSLSLGSNHPVPASQPPLDTQANDHKPDSYVYSSRSPTPRSPLYSYASHPSQAAQHLSCKFKDPCRISRHSSEASFESDRSNEKPITVKKESTSDGLAAVIEDPSASDTEDDMPPTPDADQVAQSAEIPGSGRSRCTFDPDCGLLSPDRKVTSHYFGRNKKETRAIPEECWVLYCRQHYQRVRYRSLPHDFASIQMQLVQATVDNLKAWGHVKDFNISLRKRAMDAIKKEDEYGKAVHEARERDLEPPPPYPYDRCRERWLLQFTGNGRSFEHVNEFIDMVSTFCLTQKSPALEFEIVPNFAEKGTKRREVVRRTTLNDKHGGGSRVTKPPKSGAGIGSQMRTKILTSRPAVDKT